MENTQSKMEYDYEEDEIYYNYLECCYCGMFIAHDAYNHVDCNRCGKNMCMYLVQLREKIKGENTVQLNEKKKEKKEKEKFSCDCGGRYTQGHKSLHERTKKHINFIKSKEEEQKNIDRLDRCDGCGRHDDFCRCGDFMGFGEY